MPLPQLVYIMDCPSAGLYKIGRAWFPRDRAVAVARAVQAPVCVLAEFEVGNAAAEERALHRAFAGQRRRFGSGWGKTEWFELSPLDVLSIMLMYYPVGVVWPDAFGRFEARCKEFAQLVADRRAAALRASRPAVHFPLCLTRAQAAEMLSLSPTLIGRAVKAGALRSIGRGRGWRVKRDDVLALAARADLAELVEKWRDGKG